MSFLAGYDPIKAAQVVAYFAMKQGGGVINVLKVTKLAYLAERESMRQFDEPMFFDTLASLPDGPVPSITLNLMNGNTTDTGWAKYVGGRAGYDIPLARRDLNVGDLDRLSEADLAILDALWAKFGSMNQYGIRDWTHVRENVPEWIDPRGSSRPIEHETVFANLGKGDPSALAESVNEFRSMAEALSDH